VTSRRTNKLAYSAGSGNEILLLAERLLLQNYTAVLPEIVAGSYELLLIESMRWLAQCYYRGIQDTWRIAL